MIVSKYNIQTIYKEKNSDIRNTIEYNFAQIPVPIWLDQKPLKNDKIYLITMLIFNLDNWTDS